jgi:polysaccharide biosynthesis protein PslG
MSGQGRSILGGGLVVLALAVAIGVYASKDRRSEQHDAVTEELADEPGPAPPPQFFGVNAQALFDLPAGKVESHLRAMAEGGLQVVRRDAPWVVAEPEAPVDGRHSYRWERFDREVGAYARHGLRWLPIVDYSTEWSGRIAGDVFSPPARVDEYAAYARALAGRYGRGGSFWDEHPELPQLPATRFEIWNEPNAELFWHPTTDAPERYAELYLAARAAIRQVDPTARVLVGGLALGNTDVSDEHAFVEAMVKHRPELVEAVDAVAYHPYAPSADGVLTKISEFRATLRRLGLGQAPLEITEVGWTTTKTPEHERAEALRSLAEQLPRTDCNITSLIPHTWLTHENDPTNPEDWFGIYNPNATPKPSGQAYTTSIRTVRDDQDTHPPTRLCEPPPDDAPADVRRFIPRANPPKRPVLWMRVVRRRGKHPRVQARLRCPAGCSVKLSLGRAARGRARSSGRVFARRALPFSARARKVTFRIPWRRAHVRLRAVASGRHGGTTRRARTLRFR